MLCVLWVRPHYEGTAGWFKCQSPAEVQYSRKDCEDEADRHLSTAFVTTNSNFFLLLLLLGSCRNDLACSIFSRTNLSLHAVYFATGF